MLLRALSAYEIFRRVSRDAVTPLRVVEFAALHPAIPRSLLRAAELVDYNLQLVANAQSGETLRRAGVLHALLRYGTRETIAETGVETFLGDVLARSADLSDRIGRDFLGHGAPA